MKVSQKNKKYYDSHQTFLRLKRRALTAGRVEFFEGKKKNNNKKIQKYLNWFQAVCLNNPGLRLASFFSKLKLMEAFQPNSLPQSQDY